MCDAEIELATLRGMIEGDDAHRRSALRDYEALLSELDRFTGIARAGAKRAPTLDSKIAVQRTVRGLEEARRALRLLYHAYEDAAYLALHGAERPDRILGKTPEEEVAGE